jgi:hypothetical protein
VGEPVELLEGRVVKTNRVVSNDNVSLFQLRQSLHDVVVPVPKDVVVFVDEDKTM